MALRYTHRGVVSSPPESILRNDCSSSYCGFDGDCHDSDHGQDSIYRYQLPLKRPSLPTLRHPKNHGARHGVGADGEQFVYRAGVYGDFRAHAVAHHAHDACGAFYLVYDHVFHADHFSYDPALRAHDAARYRADDDHRVLLPPVGRLKIIRYCQ
ncbi:MAG: hypothetical protein K6L80_12540 [Agarilytica sp.]